VISGDRRRAGVFQVADELGQQLLRAVEFVAQGTAEPASAWRGGVPAGEPLAITASARPRWLGVTEVTTLS
jgi:hypothetical protein